MEKIIFDKDKIKISRISIYDGSVCGVGFEQEGKKYFVHEAYGEDGEYITLYSVDEHGTRHFIQKDFADCCGIKAILDYDDSAINHRYAQWKKRVNVKGHSKAQALRSIPYKQYRLDGFADVLNRCFGAESEYIKAKEQIETYLDRSLSYFDSLDKFSGKSIVLEGHSEIIDDIAKAKRLINKAIKAVKSL